MSDGVVTKGELDKAKRRALLILDNWQRVTGALHGSYEWEVGSIVEDAVEIGAQAALGIYEPLKGEHDDEHQLGKG
jgi:hypothetical protein